MHQVIQILSHAEPGVPYQVFGMQRRAAFVAKRSPIQRHNAQVEVVPPMFGVVTAQATPPPHAPPNFTASFVDLKWFSPCGIPAFTLPVRKAVTTPTCIVWPDSQSTDQPAPHYHSQPLSCCPSRARAQRQFGAVNKLSFKRVTE